MKIHLKRNSIKINNKNKILLVLLLILFSVFLVFKYINNKIYPTIMNYAKSEIKKISGVVINNAISKKIEEVNSDDLFIIVRNDDKIKTIDFNPISVNKLLSNITVSIQTDLEELENGNIDKLNIKNSLSNKYDLSKIKKGIIFEVPTGIVLNNPLLANIGPKIPVRINLIGNILSSIKTNLTNYGINGALVEAYAHIEVELEVILPLSSGTVTIESDIPVAIKLIEGAVPNYYVNGNNSSTLTVPVE